MLLVMAKTGPYHGVASRRGQDGRSHFQSLLQVLEDFFSEGRLRSDVAHDGRREFISRLRSATVRGHLHGAPRDVSQGTTWARVTLRPTCSRSARPPFSSTQTVLQGRDWRVWRSHSASDARGDHRTVDALHVRASVVPGPYVPSLCG